MMLIPRVIRVDSVSTDEARGMRTRDNVSLRLYEPLELLSRCIVDVVKHLGGFPDRCSERRSGRLRPEAVAAFSDHHAHITSERQISAPEGRTPSNPRRADTSPCYHRNLRTRIQKEK